MNWNDTLRRLRRIRPSDAPTSVPKIQQRDAVSHLLVEPGTVCWWCQAQPATTGEHKFKASDLARMIDGTTQIWRNDVGEQRELCGRGAIQRDRHGVVKFPKSLCDNCNNARSQPFDRAYEKFSEYLANHPHLHTKSGIDFRRVYGSDWEDPVLNLARYYGKHFGCQIVRTGIGVPDSLRAFLDGVDDMPNIHMVLLTTDSILNTIPGQWFKHQPRRLARQSRLHGNSGLRGRGLRRGYRRPIRLDESRNP